MAETIKHTFVNYDLSHPRPTQTQRQAVSAFIGKHFRNRSAPARRAQPPPYLDDGRPLSLLPRPSTQGDSGQVFRKWRIRRSIKEGGKQSPQETGAGSEIPETSMSRFNDGNLLLRPVIECFVPGYPTEHRQKIFHTLDFLTYYLIPRATHWGKGPNLSMRCWMQMICGDITLFDSVAVWAHGVRITTLEDKDTPSVAVLWHMARALKGLQAKISTETVDKVAGSLSWFPSDDALEGSCCKCLFRRPLCYAGSWIGRGNRDGIQAPTRNDSRRSPVIEPRASRCHPQHENAESSIPSARFTS
ncbi:hypothetical protein BDV12DRAFT_180734 [Aspergillus spectabilis]